MSVGTGLELEDFCDESHVERNDSELTEEVDTVDLTMRCLFRMGVLHEGSSEPLSPFIWTADKVRARKESVAG